jgi:hypothetical protein
MQTVYRRAIRHVLPSGAWCTTTSSTARGTHGFNTPAVAMVIMMAVIAAL